jgi:hypothetical protein
MQTKISRITRLEQMWLDIIIDSELAEADFTSTEAVGVISKTPLKSGRQRMRVPTVHKLHYVLNKSEDFVKVGRVKNHGHWRYVE